MPEEAQIADQKASKETLVKTPHKINWIHILIGVVIGAVLLGAGFGVYFLTQSKEGPLAASTKVSTPSAQQATPSATATPSAKKDETADWKTYENKDAGYSIKYPSLLNKGLGYGDVGFLIQDFSNYEFPENVALATACEAGTGIGEEDCFTIYTSKEPRDVTGVVNKLQVGESVQDGQVTYTRQKPINHAGYEWTVFTSKYEKSDNKYTAKAKRDGVYYVISIRAKSESTVNANKGLLEKILLTFKFLD